MKLRDNAALALKGLGRNPLRSSLTALGILIGTSSVIAVLAVLLGFQHAVERQMEALGSGYVVVLPDRPVSDADVEPVPGRLTREDLAVLAEQVSGIQKVSPAVGDSTVVKSGEKSHAVALIGVGSEWQELRGQSVEQGRFFTAVEMEQRGKVAVLGSHAARELSLGRRPIGAEILVGSVPLTVIGVLEAKGTSLGRDADDVLLVPFDTALGLLGRSAQERIEIHIRADSASHARQVKESVGSILRRRHRLDEGQPDDFKIYLQDETVRSVDRLTGWISSLVACVLGVSLLVAGIGVMNIMLVSVTERTPEIGLRKAVGARRRDLLWQFLLEATALSAGGGTAGIALGYAAAAAFTRLLPDRLPAAHIPIPFVAGAFLFCALVGILFGAYPAGRASRLEPIVALRYE